jgi:hypothetical protein
MIGNHTISFVLELVHFNFIFYLLKTGLIVHLEQILSIRQFL